MLCHGVSVPPQSKMTALTAMSESYASPVTLNSASRASPGRLPFLTKPTF